MTPRPLFFALLTLTALALAPLLAVHASAQGVVPLEYTGTGSSIYPGLRVTVSMKAEGARWVTGYSFAGAAVKFGDIEVTITADKPGLGGLGKFPVYILVKKAGETLDKISLGEIGFNEKREYDVAVHITWPCGSNTVNVQVDSDAGTRGYNITVDEEPPLEILYQSGKAGGGLSPSVESSVRVVSSQKIGDCWHGPGTAPTPGEGSQGGSSARDKNPVDVGKLALLGLGGVFAIAGLALLTSGRRGG